MRVYPELVELLCASIARAGAPVSLGSDAHRPHRVGAVLDGLELLRAAGVREAVAFERAPPARLPAVTRRRRARASRCSLRDERVRRLVPAVVIALRDFGPATATLVRMLAGGAVLAFAARGRFGALRGSRRARRLIGAFGLGVQSWLLSYAMTHVGGALPALVLGLEPIVIGLVGSLVVREHVGARLRVAFALGLAGEAVIAGFVTRGRGRAAAPAAARAGRRRHALLGLQRLAAPARRAALGRRRVRRVARRGRCGAAARARRARARRRRAGARTPAPSGAWCSRRSSPPGLGYLAWAGALSRVRAAVAALGLYLVPIGGALASHIGLGEPLYARHAVGAAIVVAAIVLGRSRVPGSRPAERPPRLDAAMRRYSVTTFGCQMNVHDSERMKGLLESLGLGEATSPEEADVLVFNTCTIREKADERFHSRLMDARMAKQRDPSKVIVVGGCWSESVKDELFELYPFVDLAYGPGNISRLGEFIQAGGDVPRGHFSTFDEFSGDLPMRRERPFQAWLQISQGCNSTCSYCIVPSVRGREQSRPAARSSPRPSASRPRACAS